MIDSEMAVALWTLFHDKEFLRANHTVLDPELVPRGASRYLVALAKSYWQDQKAILDPQAMDIVLDAAEAQRYGSTYEATVDVYVDIYERFEFNPDNLPVFRQAATKWFRSLSLSQRIDEAMEALEGGDLEAADKALREGHRSITPHQRGKNLRDDFRDVLATDWPPACPTGFAILDKAWCGGIHLGLLGSVIAPWNTGKSMILPNFAGQALKANKNVLYYTTELDENTVIRRVASSLVRQPINTMDVDQAVEGIHRLFSLWGARAGSEEGDSEDPWFEVMYRDALTLSVKDIEADLDMLEEEGHRIHLVILDGDDIRCDRKFDKPYDMFLYIYTDLGSLAQRRQIAIWTAAQGSRDSSKAQIVQGHHIADSIAKIRKADLALGMQHREHDRDGEGNLVMRINVLKDRFFGTKDQKLQVRMYFGQGLNGYAAFGPAEEWYQPRKEDNE